jgi:cell division protein FtsB
MQCLTDRTQKQRTAAGSATKQHAVGNVAIHVDDANDSIPAPAVLIHRDDSFRTNSEHPGRHGTSSSFKTDFLNMADSSTEVDQVRADIQRNEDQIKEINAHIKQKEAEISDKEIVLLSKAPKAQRDYAGSRIVDLTAQIKDLNGQIKDLNGHINLLRSKLVEQRTQQTKRMVAAAADVGPRGSTFVSLDFASGEIDEVNCFDMWLSCAPLIQVACCHSHCIRRRASRTAVRPNERLGNEQAIRSFHRSRREL